MEEVFTAVLSPSSSNSNTLKQIQHTHHPAAAAAAGKTNPVNTGTGCDTASGHQGAQLYAELTVCTLLPAAAMFPHVPLMNGLMGASPHVVGGHGHALGQAPPTPGPAGGDGSSGGEQDALSTAQRSMLKWEKEEVLGEMATVAPVLYCNTNFPQLREQFPGKSSRSSRHTVW